jgi:hypothetical protein
MISIALSLVATAVASNENVIHNFVAFPRGAYRQSNLTADAAGNLYGTNRA